MEKTLTIDGRQVAFKSSGAFLLRYKAQFGRDAFQDVMKMQDAFKKDRNGDTVLKNGKPVMVDINALDLTIFYNLAWTLARTADPTIPLPMEWLDSFGSFPLSEIMPEIMDLLELSLGATVKPKNV